MPQIEFNDTQLARAFRIVSRVVKTPDFNIDSVPLDFHWVCNSVEPEILVESIHSIITLLPWTNGYTVRCTCGIDRCANPNHYEIVQAYRYNTNLSRRDIIMLARFYDENEPFVHSGPRGAYLRPDGLFIDPSQFGIFRDYLSGLEKVTMDGDHWLWKNKTLAVVYGGSRYNPKKLAYAWTVSQTPGLPTGNLPSNVQMTTLCGHNHCVNPFHQMLTFKENVPALSVNVDGYKPGEHRIEKSVIFDRGYGMGTIHNQILQECQMGMTEQERTESLFDKLGETVELTGHYGLSGNQILDSHWHVFRRDPRDTFKPMIRVDPSAIKERVWFHGRPERWRRIFYCIARGETGPAPAGQLIQFLNGNVRTTCGDHYCVNPMHLTLTDR